MNVPNQALVVVVDGEKALFLRNKGSSQEVSFEVEQIFATTIRRPMSKPPINQVGRPRAQAPL